MSQTPKQQMIENPWDLTLGTYYRLCFFLNSLGITPEEVAKLVKASPTEIKKIEQGQFCLPPDWMIQFLTQFGIDPDWLITGTFPRTEKNPAAYDDLLTHLEVPEIHRAVMDEFKKAKNNLQLKFKKNAGKRGKRKSNTQKAEG